MIRRPPRSTLSSSSAASDVYKRQTQRRGGRVVDCAGLENRRAARSRGFESHPLRHLGLAGPIVRQSVYSWGFLRLFIWLETQVCAPFTAILRGIRVESDAFLSRIWRVRTPALARMAGRHHASDGTVGRTLHYGQNDRISRQFARSFFIGPTFLHSAGFGKPSVKSNQIGARVGRVSLFGAGASRDVLPTTC